MPFAAIWRTLEMIILTEASYRKKNIMLSFICGILENDTDELTKQKQTHIENNLKVTKREK